MRRVRAGLSVLVRPQDTPRSRPALRGHADLPGGGDAPRRVPRCGKVKQETLDWLADNPFYTKRFAFFVGRRCRSIDDQGCRRGNPAGLEDDQGP